jgi:hypothetical protein
MGLSFNQVSQQWASESLQLLIVAQTESQTAAKWTIAKVQKSLLKVHEIEV